jgi:diguanylate cyclase (GGDEF)-like protein/PAS domain S-box-containing protein
VSGADYFETLYAHAPFGYLVTDTSDVITRVNATMLTWGGYREEQLLGQPFRSFLTPGSQLLYETKHLPVVRLQGFAHEVFLQFVAADGTILPVLINTDIVAAAGVGMGASTAIGSDEVRIGVLAATGRVSYEQELLSAQRNAERLVAQVAILQNASAAFATSNTEVAVAETLASILEGALVAPAVCVAFEEPSGRLTVVAGTNLLEEYLPDDPQLLGRDVLRLETPVVVGRTEEDWQRYPSVVQALHAARLHTVAVFPIMNDATPIGVTAAFFGRQRELPENETEMVLSVSRQASLVLTRLRAQDALAYSALHDQLTGLANRAFVRENIARALASAASSAHPLAVMFIDLDGFKAVNDRLGHHVGDAILRGVAQRLDGSVRAEDFVGRYGGDEFVVICQDTGTLDSAAIARRIHAEVRLPYPEAEGFAISASIGIAVHSASVHTVSAPSVAVDDLISAADAAMYESKRLGRDRTTQVSV